MKLGVAAPTTSPSVAPSTAANLGSAPVTLDFKGSGLFGPETGLGRSKVEVQIQVKIRKTSHFTACTVLVDVLQCVLCAGMPTCILCVCLRGSVYCDDMALDQIPPLPKDTSYFYARFNRIRHVKNTDFLNLGESRDDSRRRRRTDVNVGCTSRRFLLLLLLLFQQRNSGPST